MPRYGQTVEPKAGLYIVVGEGRVTLYGPFDRDAAQKYNYFRKSVAERDARGSIAGMRSTTGIAMLLEVGLNYYDANEIAAITRYPEEWGFKSVRVVSRPPPMHETWKKLDAEFREYLFSNDVKGAS